MYYYCGFYFQKLRPTGGGGGNHLLFPPPFATRLHHFDSQFRAGNCHIKVLLENLNVFGFDRPQKYASEIYISS